MNDETEVLTIRVFKDGRGFRGTLEASWAYEAGRKTWRSPIVFTADTAVGVVNKINAEVLAIGTHEKPGPKPMGHVVAKRLV